MTSLVLPLSNTFDKKMPEHIRSSDSQMSLSAQTANFVQALHDHIQAVTNTTNQLYFKRGAIIEVTSREKNGWWEGTADGHRGWFPSSLVGRIGDVVRASTDLDEMPPKELDTWHVKRAMSSSGLSFSKKLRSSPLSHNTAKPRLLTVPASLSPSIIPQSNTDPMTDSLLCRWQSIMDDVLKHITDILSIGHSNAHFECQESIVHLVSTVRLLVEETPAEFQEKCDTITKALGMVIEKLKGSHEYDEKKEFLLAINELTIELISLEYSLQLSRGFLPSPSSDIISHSHGITNELVRLQARIEDLVSGLVESANGTVSMDQLEAVELARQTVRLSIGHLLATCKDVMEPPKQDKQSGSPSLTDATDSATCSLSSSSTSLPRPASEQTIVSDISRSFYIFGSVSAARTSCESIRRSGLAAERPSCDGDEEESTISQNDQADTSPTAIASDTSSSDKVTVDTSSFLKHLQRIPSKGKKSKRPVTTDIAVVQSKSTSSFPDKDVFSKSRVLARKLSVPSIKPTASLSEKLQVSSSSHDIVRRHTILTSLKQFQGRRKKSLKGKSSDPVVPINPISYASKELRMEDGEVRAASIKVLVDLLTLPERSEDDLFEAAFFYSMCHYTRPCNVAQLLVERFQQCTKDPVSEEESSSEDEAERVARLQKRVVAVIIQWIKHYYCTFKDYEASHVLLPFVKSPEAEPFITPSEVQELCRLLDPEKPPVPAKNSTSSLSLSTSPCAPSIVISKPTPQKSTSKPLPHRGSMQNLSSTPIYRRFSPVHFAEQLTLMESSMFRKLSVSELMGLKKKTDACSLPAVKAIVQRNCQIVSWLVAMIQNETNQKRCAQLLEFWIKVAEHCLLLGNLNTLMAICTALNSSNFDQQAGALEEVKRSWRHRRTIEMIQNFTNFDRNFAKYRRRLREADPTKPCIPFLGIFLKDLVALDESMPDHYAAADDMQLIHFGKFLQMTKTIRGCIVRSQMRYPLHSSKETQVFLSRSFISVMDNETDQPCRAPKPSQSFEVKTELQVNA